MEWKLYAKLAKLAYSQQQDLKQELALLNIELIAWYSSNDSTLSYYIAKDANGVYIIGVKGTSDINDVLVDLNCMATKIFDNLPFLAHGGMLTCAKTILDSILSQNINFEDKNIILVGHSLGGGVAAILKNLLNYQNISAKRIECIIFGAAASISGQEELHRNITSFINNNDIVPRLALRNVELLLDQLNSYQMDNFYDFFVSILDRYYFQDGFNLKEDDLRIPGQTIYQILKNDIYTSSSSNYVKLVLTTTCVEDHSMDKYIEKFI